MDFIAPDCTPRETSLLRVFSGAGRVQKFRPSRRMLSCFESRDDQYSNVRRLIRIRVRVPALRRFRFPMIATPTVVKIVTCLLCLVVVGAALDKLPDPPAIKPSGIQKNPIFQLVHIPVSAITNLASDCFSCRLQLQTGFIPATQVSDCATFLAEPFVLQAADASPPRHT